MAIRDTTIKEPFLQDRDKNTHIGLDLPIRRSTDFITGSIENIGYFATTYTTMEATKNNIKNLLQTNRGERYYHPTMGVGLAKYQFEQFNNEIKSQIIQEIHETFGYWLPYVSINNLNVGMAPSNSNISNNSLLVSITFSVNNNPNILDSVQVTVGE